MKSAVVLFGVLAILQIVSSMPNKREAGKEDDDQFMNDYRMNEDDYDIEEDNENFTDDGEKDEERKGPLPVIKSKSLKINIDPGKNVQLPCEGVNTEAFVVIWKKNSEPIFQDKIAVGPQESRYTRFPNASLLIKNVGPNDTADYECLIVISQNDKVNVIHKLEVNTPPKITRLSTTDSATDVILGKAVELICDASGIPPPKITWSKSGSRLHGQHGKYEGPSILFQSIQKDNAGLYQCLADNGVGVPATSGIEIRVIYPPTIKIEKLTVNSAEDYESQLTCIVHSLPKANVEWKKGNEVIQTNDHVKVIVEGNRHILKIMRTKESDFGNYSCNAVNRLGHTSKHIKLVGEPAMADFVNVKMSKEGSQATLEWRVESNSPISDYHLQYRLKNKNEDWKNEHPKVINGEGSIYKVVFTIKDLDLDAYEVRLRSKNNYGWSYWSHYATFGGEIPEDEPIPVSENREEPVPQVGSSSGSERTLASMLIIAIFMLYSNIV